MTFERVIVYQVESDDITPVLWAKVSIILLSGNTDIMQHGKHSSLQKYDTGKFFKITAMNKYDFSWAIHNGVPTFK